MPPLRERREDIPLLAQGFLREFSAENEKKVKEISTEAMEALRQYPWPGNVRELRAAIEHAVVLCRGDRIVLRDLPPGLRSAQEPARGVGAPKLGGTGDLTIKEAEKQLIVRALQECQGNRTEAAQKLGMSRRTLHRKLHTYQLEDS